MDYEAMLKKGLHELPKKRASEERFAVPKAITEKAGRRTIITNIFEIASTLRRDPNHVIKYLLKELATKGEIVGQRLFILGVFTSDLINKKLEHYVNATRCINCLCCASACISSHEAFLGPNAMLACIIRVMDPRELEKEQRKKTLYSDAGVYRCHSSEACSHVCPKEIDVAHFIALAKEGRFKTDD